MIIADLLAAVRNDRSNLVRLLDKWSLKWKHKGRTTAVGPNAFEKYWTLGLYGHGCISGISRASNEEDLQSRQSFLKSRFPGKLGLPSRFFAIVKERASLSFLKLPQSGHFLFLQETVSCGLEPERPRRTLAVSEHLLYCTNSGTSWQNV